MTIEQQNVEQSIDRRSTYIDFFDPLRGIAIVGVFIFHALDFLARNYAQLPWDGWFRTLPTPRWLVLVFPGTLGWAGVALFFVISGFCIHLSFSRSRQPSFTNFYLRRFFRIYPPYLFALLLFAFVIPRHELAFGPFSTWQQLGLHLALINNIDIHSIYRVNNSFWSIAIEAQLYVIYPVLLFLASKLGWRKSLAVLAVLEVFLRLVAPVLYLDATQQAKIPTWIEFSPLTYWYSWSIGAWLADAYLLKKPLPFVKAPLWLWAAFAIGTYLIKPLYPLSFLFFAILTTAWIAKRLNGEVSLLRLPNFCTAYLSRIGVLSYSIYLLHQPLMDQAVILMIKLRPSLFAAPLPKFLVALSAWLFIVPLSALLYRYCELPSIRLGKIVIEKMRMAKQSS
ncbi:MAG: acyltransferase [Phormidium tanganyikae FI6-MK23]|jgi:peptidoglycan/LPS O-acetylase OafA/YrhL|nr:acyltransferase [Phormidium tanganyikae FI6-MK23]